MKITPFLLVAALAPLFSRAASRSANYTIPADTIDSGGQHATSINYTHEVSAGSPAGFAATVSGLTVARHGYVAQLAEATNVVVSALSTNVDELATLQLTATARLDDGSWLAIPSPNARWSVTVGPASIGASSGLLTAGVVYQHTQAVARAAYLDRTGTLGLLVRDALPDNFGDYAGDGLPDGWQLNYFGPANPNANPGADPDRDGQANAFEYEVGSSPIDPASALRISIITVPGFPTHRLLTVTPGRPDRSYVVAARNDLIDGSYVPVATTLTFGNGNAMLLDPLATNAHKFYRVLVTAPQP